MRRRDRSSTYIAVGAVTILIASMANPPAAVSSVAGIVGFLLVLGGAIGYFRGRSGGGGGGWGDSGGGWGGPGGGGEGGSTGGHHGHGGGFSGGHGGGGGGHGGH